MASIQVVYQEVINAAERRLPNKGPLNRSATYSSATARS